MRPAEANPTSKNFGELAEWSNAAVLKTVDLNGSGGSNPSLSAEKGVTDICSAFFSFSVTKNVTKISVRPIFHSKKMQVESGEKIFLGTPNSKTIENKVAIQCCFV